MAGTSYGEDFFEGYGGRLNQYWWARRFYAELIKRHGRRGGRLLEIGCGLGHLLARLDGAFETYGIDVSPYAVERARANAPRSDLRVATAEQLDTLPGPFDVIAAFHVLEHVEDPAGALAAMARNTAPAGVLVYATPNPEAPFAERKGDRWYGRRDPTHISMKPPGEWLDLTRRAGYRVRRAFGDGLWDVPYLPLIPAKLQLPLFGLPAIVQTVTARPFIPVRLGEALIVVAERSA